MDVIDLLPLELWLKIFDYLPMTDVQRAMSVHRMFHEAGLARTRRKLTLCSRGLGQHRRVRSIMNQPALGSQVWHAHISPGKPEYGGLCDHPDFASTPASLFSWVRVKRYIQEVFLTHKRALGTAVQGVAHLPNIHHVTVDVLRAPAKFSSAQLTRLWTALHPSNIKVLDLIFKSPQLGFLSQSIQNTALVFDGVEELKLFQDVNPGQPAIVAADLGRIIDTTRRSLRSLFLHIKEKLSPDSLGHIPNLSRLQVVVSGEEQEQPYRNFLKLHKSTLRHLVLKPVSTSAVHTLWYEYDPEDCPKLQTIDITFSKFPGRTISSSSSPFPHFGPFVDSLTTLSVHGIALPYEGVQKLVGSLHDPRRGSVLQRLRINVDRMSPELMDLFAQHLKALELLDLLFYELTGSKERPRQGKRDFEKGMGSRVYPNWKLRSLYLRRKERKGIVENVKLMHYLAERIPSIEDFGPFDWTDVENSPNPVA